MKDYYDLLNVGEQLTIDKPGNGFLHLSLNRGPLVVRRLVSEAEITTCSFDPVKFRIEEMQRELDLNCIREVDKLMKEI